MFGSLMNFEDNPFDDFRRIQQDFDQWFGGWPWPTSIRSAARGTYPPVNVGTTPEHIDVYMFAAGLDPKTLDISLNQNLLTVAGERPASGENDAGYYRKERFAGNFRRSMTLPEDADPDQVNARYTDGVLHIQIKRREAARPRQITVN